MDSGTALVAARSALEVTARRAADLIRSAPDLDALIPGSEWTIRDAAVHLLNWSPVHAELATGSPPPLERFDRATLATDNAYRIADVPVSDPDKLAALVVEGASQLLEVTAGQPGDRSVNFHRGLEIDLAGLVCISLGEHLLHGYDMAVAAGCPWPIRPAHAGLVLYGHGPWYSKLVNGRVSDGPTASFEVQLRRFGRFRLHYFEDQCRFSSADSEPADCIISGDPVAFLLVASGRLSQWSAFALDLLQTSGPRPELAVRLPELLGFP